MLDTTLLLFNLGTGEIIIICLVILLLFGGRKIPELMKGLGKGVKSFKEGMNEVQQEVQKSVEDVEADSKKTANGKDNMQPKD